jgi:hypothetical protein
MFHHRSLQTKGVFGVNCRADKNEILVGILFINPDEDIPENLTLINQEIPGVKYHITLTGMDLQPTNYNCVLKIYDN